MNRTRIVMLNILYDPRQYIKVYTRHPVRLRTNLYRMARRNGYRWRFRITNKGVMVVKQQCN